MNREVIELREVVQKLVPLLAGRNLLVTQRGSQAYVRTNAKTKRPESVNIPNIPDNATPDFVRAIQGFIDHEVGHVLKTDWNYYGRGPSPEDLKKPEVRAFLNTHNIIEDVMIEREMIKIFPGSEKNISDTRKYFLSRITAEALKKAADDKEAFVYLAVPMMRALGGHVEMIEFMDDGGYWKNSRVDALLKAMKPETLELLKTCTTTKETLVIAEEVHAIMYPAKAPEPPKEEEKTPPPPPKPPAPPKPPKEEKKKDPEPEPEEKKTAGEGDGDEERDHEETGDDGDGDAEDDKEKDDAEKDDEGEPADEEDDAGAGDDDADDGMEEEDPGEDDGDGDDSDDTADLGEPEDDDDGASKDEDDDSEPEAEDDEPGDGEAVGGEEEDEDDLDLDDLPPSTAGADPDDGEGEESAEADEGSGSSPFRLSGDEGGGVGDIDDANEENDESIGGGAGNAGAKSLFDYEDDAFDEADMSSQIAILISDEAVLAMDPSQYVVFTREMDRVEPIVVPGDIEPTWVPQMEDAVRAAVGRMKKDVERMMASQSHVIRTPGHRRGKLHSPSLYRVQQGDPRVFSVKQEHTSKDTAVSLLMDNSGSMRGQKMRLATLAGYALSSTLEAVKISHEVLGFTSGSFYDVPPVLREAMRLDMERSGIDYDRVEPIMIPIYKDFDERMNSEIKRRFAYMMYGQRGLAGNIDGESLQYAAERLIKRPEKRKVMLVFSDGQPAGSDKSGPHLSWVVKDLERQGIETIGIGIMDRSVKKFYPKNVVLNDAAELPNEVMTAIKKILA